MAAQPPESAQQILEQGGMSPTQFAALDWKDIWNEAVGLAAENAQEPVRAALRMLLYLLLAGTVTIVAGQGNWARCMESVAVLGFGGIGLSAMMRLLDSVNAVTMDSQAYLASFVPAYAGVILLGGQTAGAAVYGGMFLSVSAAISLLIQNVLTPLMQIYFCVSVSGVLWGNAGVEQAAALFEKLLSALLKLCGTILGFVLGLQAVFAGNVDSAALKLGKNVLAGAIPVVGDAAAAALSSAASAVQMLKGSLALAAVLTLGTAFAPVFLHCALYYLAFAAAGILASGTGQRQNGKICLLFAKGAGLCASILTLYFFLIFFTTILLLLTGSGG